MNEYSKYSQQGKTDLYSRFLGSITNTYICECSRKTLQEFANGYQGENCLNSHIKYQKDKNCIRYHQTQEILGHDPVLWRKENIPAYHLVNLYEDIEDQITHIIRGQDLYSSSKIQKLIAKEQELHTFSNIDIYHHDLMMNGDEKLSKSNKDQYLRFDDVKSKMSLFQSFSKFIGLNKKIKSIEELIQEEFPNNQLKNRL